MLFFCFLFYEGFRMLFYKDVCIKFVNGFVVVVFFVFFVLDIYFIKSIVRENIEELVRSMFL